MVPRARPRPGPDEDGWQAPGGGVIIAAISLAGVLAKRPGGSRPARHRPCPLQAYAAGLAPAQRGVMVAAWVSAVRAGQASGPVLVGACLASFSARGAIALGAAVSVGLAGAVLLIRHAVTLRR